MPNYPLFTITGRQIKVKEVLHVPELSKFFENHNGVSIIFNCQPSNSKFESRQLRKKFSSKLLKLINVTNCYIISQNIFSWSQSFIKKYSIKIYAAEEVHSASVWILTSHRPQYFLCVGVSPRSEQIRSLFWSDVFH